MARLEIGESLLGFMILLLGIGGIVTMPWCGILIDRFGSRAITRISSVICSVSLLLVVIAPSVICAGMALILFGSALGGMDVAMNVNAIEVERRLSRAVMSSCHGFWSLGGFAGSGIGGLLIETSGHLIHAVLVVAVVATVALFVLSYLTTELTASTRGKSKIAFPANPLIYLIGIVALFSMVSEGSVLDWSALYLRQHGADPATAGFAFAAFSGTMSIMRFVGDGVRNRYGSATILRASALVGSLGLFVAGMAFDAWVTILAFAFTGLGLANIVPIAFAAAGKQKGTSPGRALGVVTLMGYTGILAAPSAVGLIAERTGFRPVYVALAGLLLIIALMAPVASAADRKTSSDGQTER